jgi:hypothetical protein
MFRSNFCWSMRTDGVRNDASVTLPSVAQSRRSDPIRPRTGGTKLFGGEF